MNFSIGDWHFVTHVCKWDFNFPMFGVMVALALGITTFLLWKGRERS